MTISSDSDKKAEEIWYQKEVQASTNIKDRDRWCLLYKSRNKSGGLVNVRMSSMVFLPLRGHGAKGIDDDGDQEVEKLRLSSLKVTAALTPP